MIKPLNSAVLVLQTRESAVVPALLLVCHH